MPWSQTGLHLAHDHGIGSYGLRAAVVVPICFLAGDHDLFRAAHGCFLYSLFLRLCSGGRDHWITGRVLPGPCGRLLTGTVEVLTALPGELWPFLCICKEG